MQSRVDTLVRQNGSFLDPNDVSQDECGDGRKNRQEKTIPAGSILRSIANTYRRTRQRE